MGQGAAERKKSREVAGRNKMDLALGVAVGSSVQMSLMAPRSRLNKRDALLCASGREGSAEAKEKAAKLVRRCWDNAPAKRPTFGRIVADLQRMLRKLPGGPPGAPASPSKRAQQRGLE